MSLCTFQIKTTNLALGLRERLFGNVCQLYDTCFTSLKTSVSHPSIINLGLYPSRMEEFTPTHFSVWGLFQWGLWCSHSLDIYISPAISIREWVSIWLHWRDPVENWIPRPLAYPHYCIKALLQKLARSFHEVLGEKAAICCGKLSLFNVSDAPAGISSTVLIESVVGCLLPHVSHPILPLWK